MIVKLRPSRYQPRIYNGIDRNGKTHSHTRRDLPDV